MPGVLSIADEQNIPGSLSRLLAERSLEVSGGSHAHLGLEAQNPTEGLWAWQYWPKFWIRKGSAQTTTPEPLSNRL